MEQNGADEPADAATAFEALRREVALLNVAVAGLAAERAPAPDYSETLGYITKGVSVAVGQLGKVMASPAFTLSPADLAQQIAAAGDEARRQDRVALHLARDHLAQAARDLCGWIDAARLANRQNLRLVQAASVGALAGIVLAACLPGIVARAAPQSWHWPEKMAALVLKRDLWAAGDQILLAADAARWSALRTCRLNSQPKRRPSQSDERRERRNRQR